MTKKQQKKCFVSAAILMTAIIAASLFCGCAQQYGQRNPDETVYSAQFAYSDVEYTMYVNRELDPVANALSANLMLARNTANQEYPREDALASAQAALDTVQASKENINVMQPAKGYEEYRLDVLQAVANVENTFETYINILQEDVPDRQNLLAIADVMESDFIAVTALFNIVSE